MKPFNKIIEETMRELDISYSQPKSLPSYFKPKEKININNQTKIAGKYFKGNENVSRSMISDRDRKKATEKGQTKAKFETQINNRRVIMSKTKFDRLFNDNGERTIELKEGNPKVINSKDHTFTAELLPNGLVLVKRSNSIDSK